MDQFIQDFIDCKRIAVIGISRSGRKFGNAAYDELKKRGYEVFAVHPAEKEISGARCYSSLSELKDIVEGVLISIPSEKAKPVLEEASSLGIKNIWLQKGAESPELLKAAESLDMHPVTGKCILMYAPPVGSAHAVHRFFTKLFGKL